MSLRAVLRGGSLAFRVCVRARTIFEAVIRLFTYLLYVVWTG